MDDAINKLDTAWETTTKGIHSGSNKGIKFTRGRKKIGWSLLYDASEKLDDKFLSDLPKVEIANLLKFVGDTVGMWEKFSHIKSRYIKRKNPETLALNACILAEALGISAECVFHSKSNTDFTASRTLISLSLERSFH